MKIRKLFQTCAIAACWGLINAPIAVSQETLVSKEENPYVELYRLRVAQAELNQKRQEALVALASARLDRGRRLLAEKVIARDEYESLFSDAAVTSTDLELAGKKIDEARAYLRIIEALVKRGVSIPLCTYDME